MKNNPIPVAKKSHSLLGADCSTPVSLALRARCQECLKGRIRTQCIARHADHMFNCIRRHLEARWNGAWTDFVEVSWRDHCQAYVTPVGSNEACVALIGSAGEARLSDRPTLFPALANRLCGGPADDWRPERRVPRSRYRSLLDGLECNNRRTLGEQSPPILHGSKCDFRVALCFELPDGEGK